MLGQLLKRITGAERRFASPPAAAKLHVGSRISCIDKHWSEMTANERVEAGPFLCFVNPDEFDKRFGKFVEFMILYKDYSEYEELKKFAIESGRLEKYLR